MNTYKLTDDKKLVACPFAEWAEWFETINRQVDITEVGDLVVSTVFLGYSVNDNVFETALFEKGEFLEVHDRYPTWNEAVQGHKDAVTDLMKSEP